jgi:hypothetical protein
MSLEPGCEFFLFSSSEIKEARGMADQIQIALECGRPDDARLWTLLNMLIMEFAPTANRDSFDEEIFTHPLESIKRMPTPEEMSPRGHGKGESSPVLSTDIPFTSTYIQPIALQRVDDEMEDVEELLSTNSSSASNSSSSSYAKPAKSKSRFLSFVPPDISSAPTLLNSSDSNESSPNPNHPHFRDSTATVIISPATVLLNNNYNKSNPVSVAISKSSSSNSSSAADWPDPYGVLPGSSTPRTQIQTQNQTQAGNVNASTDTSASTVKRNSGQGLQQGMRSSPMIEAKGSGKEVVVKDLVLDKEVREYKEERLRVLRRWWEGCIDDVSGSFPRLEGRILMLVVIA